MNPMETNSDYKEVKSDTLLWVCEVIDNAIMKTMHMCLSIPSRWKNGQEMKLTQEIEKKLLVKKGKLVIVTVILQKCVTLQCLFLCVADKAYMVWRWLGKFNYEIKYTFLFVTVIKNCICWPECSEYLKIRWTVLV